MKKSIFLFFAAILCAMTANAQWALMGTLTDWSSGKAMTVSGTTATCTVELPGKTTYTLKVKNSGTWYGRNSTTISATTTTGAFSTSGGDVTLNTDIPGTYTFSFNTSSKTLTVTYPTAPAPHDITVRAQVPASWTNTITAWVWTSENGTGEEVTPTKDGDYYVVTKNAGALYAIFKNGAGWNGDKNQTVDLCYTEDVCLQINQSGSAKATATVIECGAVAKDITVKAVVPGAWEETITAWVWPTGGEGKEVTPTKDGNWYVVTENCIELNVIFKNGTGWNGDENQTVNIEGVTENTCYQISALNKVDGKCSVAIVDCEAAIEPEAKPEPTPTYDYYITGSFNGWNEKDPAHGMTLDGEVYKATVTLATGENLVKVTNGTWTDAKGYGAMGAEYEEVSLGASDDNILVDLTEGKEVVVVYNATTKKVTFEGLTEKAPSPTFDYYITGSFNGNNPKKAENGMTLDGTVYKATVTLAVGDNTLKVTDGTWENTWGANELGAAYEEVSNPNDYNNIKITLAAEQSITVIFDATAGKITFEGLTEKAPEPTFDYYITGSFNDNDPKKAANGMTLDGEVYKATVTLGEGDNTLKVTDGTWEKTWGANELGAAYDEVSNPNDYNNIKITLAAEKEITVIFDATAGKITFEGLSEVEPETLVYTVEVPEGTEDCYIAGQMNDWDFERMTQVDATHWTITYDNVFKTTEYKYACQASWDYKELDQEGNDVANRTWTANDVVEKWNNPYTEVRTGLTVGQWGTLCPKQNVENPTGATFYQIAYLEEKCGMPFNMYFDEVEGNLEAGQPYFFIASATEIKGIKSGEPKTEGSNVNGFYGYIGETSWTLPYQASFDATSDENTFVIWNNSVFRINAETSIKSERCYININSSEPSRMPAPAPVGARRITMGVSGVNGQNTATGVDQVQGGNVPTKMIINGQLYILRGEKMYDAQGKLVK